MEAMGCSTLGLRISGPSSPLRPSPAEPASILRLGSGASTFIRSDSAGRSTPFRRGSGLSTSVRPSSAGPATFLRPGSAGPANFLRPGSAGPSVSLQRPGSALPTSALRRTALSVSSQGSRQGTPSSSRPRTALHSRSVLPLSRSREPSTVARPRSAAAPFATPAHTSDFFAERAQLRLAADDVSADTVALAMADFGRAISMDPASARARHARALALAREGHLAAALFDLDRAVESISAQPGAQPGAKPGAHASGHERGAVFLARGYARQEAGRQLEALSDFERALECAPDLPEHYIARATCLRKLGRFSEAIDDYNAARCLEQPARFAEYKARHRIKRLTAEKVVRISRRIAEETERRLAALASPRRGGAAGAGGASALQRRHSADLLGPALVSGSRAGTPRTPGQRARLSSGAAGGTSWAQGGLNLLIAELAQEGGRLASPTRIGKRRSSASSRGRSPLAAQRLGGGGSGADGGGAGRLGPRRSSVASRAGSVASRASSCSRRTSLSGLSGGTADEGGSEEEEDNEEADGAACGLNSDEGEERRYSEDEDDALAAGKEAHADGGSRAGSARPSAAATAGGGSAREDEDGAARRDPRPESRGSAKKQRAKNKPLASERAARCVAALLRPAEQRTAADERELLSVLTRGFGVSSHLHQLASHFADPAVRRHLLTLLSLAHFEPGEVVLRPAEPQTHALLVLHGALRLSCAGPAEGAGAPPFDSENPPPLAQLEARGYRHVGWTRGSDHSLELRVKLVPGDCVGGTDVLEASRLRERLADGLSEPPERTEPSGLVVAARRPTVAISIPLAALEATFLRVREAECNTILAQLADMQLFKAFSAQALLRLARHMDVRTCQRGEVLMAQGAQLTNCAVCFVHSGQCSVTRLVERGGGAPPTRVELGTLWAFECFGEQLVFDAQAMEAHATVTADTIATVYALPARHAAELSALSETLRADFAERYPPDRALLARRAQQRNWQSYKAGVVRDIVEAKARRASGRPFG